MGHMGPFWGGFVCPEGHMDFVGSFCVERSCPPRGPHGLLLERNRPPIRSTWAKLGLARSLPSPVVVLAVASGGFSGPQIGCLDFPSPVDGASRGLRRFIWPRPQIGFVDFQSPVGRACRGLSSHQAGFWDFPSPGPRGCNGVRRFFLPKMGR